MKKKSFYNEKRKIFMVQNLKWATAHLSRGAGARRRRRWASGRAAGVGLHGRAGERCRRAGGRCRRAGAGRSGRRAGAGRSGRRSTRQAGLAAAARRARGRLGERQQGEQGARGVHATGGRRAGKHGMGSQGRAAGHTVRAGHGRPGRWMGGRLGQLGQFWCTVHLAQFWLGFWTQFDSVFS